MQLESLDLETGVVQTAVTIVDFDLGDLPAPGPGFEGFLRELNKVRSEDISQDAFDAQVVGVYGRGRTRA
jgi:hypothetical protein